MNDLLVESPQDSSSYANRMEPNSENCSAYVCERITREGRHECFGNNVVTKF